MSTAGSPYIAFLAFALRVAARVGAVALLGGGVGTAAAYGYRRSVDGVERLPTRAFRVWVVPAALLGYLCGAIAPVPWADLVTGVVAAASVAFAAGIGTLPDSGSVLEALEGDPLFEVKATVGAIFVLYAAMRWWAVRRDLLAGLSPGERAAALREASVFTAVVVGSLFVVLAVGLLVISLIQAAWRAVVPRVEESIAGLEPEHERVIEDLEGPRVRRGSLLGSGLLVVGFLWLLARGRSGGADLVEVFVFGLAVITLYMIVGAVSDVRFVHDSSLPDPVIRAMLKREGGRLITLLVTTFAGLAVLVYAVDATLSAYYTRVMTAAPGVLSAETAALLDRGEWSSEAVVVYYDFYAGGVVAELGIRLVSVLLPAALAIVLLPYVVKYLYFQGIKRVALVVSTYLSFIGLAVTVNVLLSGAITHLGEIGLASLLPTVGAGVSSQAASWLMREREHVRCDACGERVLESGNYCLNCGHEID